MPATLAPGATQGAATQPPKQRKPRRASAFIVLQEIITGPEANPAAPRFVQASEASSIKDARAKGVDLPDGEYGIYCRRGKFTVSTPPAKKVVKASK